MVSLRQPYGRRLLLPSEIDLCKTLGISEDEYWYFVDQTAAYNGERKEGYELIPDIQAGPAGAVAFTIFGTGVTWGAIYLQIALIAVGYLLADKPKEIKAGENIQGPDSIGAKRFAPQYGFNSTQELATLGDIIPLVFTNQIEVDQIGTYTNASDVIGGLRVNGQLLWSRLLSLGRHQQLKAILLFSLGEIDGRPDFEGYALGDLLLSTYSRKKLDLFFKSSQTNRFNRLERDTFDNEGDRYPDSEVAGMKYPYPDAFSDDWFVPNSATDSTQVWPFSGARNPTTQSVFGMFNPMPNANVVKLSYELYYPQKGSENNAKRAVITKKKKIATWWPTRAGITGGDVTAVGNTITYRILRSNQKYDDTKETGTQPHGIEDVVSMIRSIREKVDSNIAIGETYMIGDGLIACTGVKNIYNEAAGSMPWRPATDINNVNKFVGIEREYTFEVVEAGSDYGEVFRHPNLLEHEQQPKWLTAAEGGVVEQVAGRHAKMLVSQNMEDYSLKHGHPAQNPILQRVAMATITNNRPCALTEIGIKSKVFSHIRGANINGIPTQAALDDIYNQRVNFQLGRIDQHLKRYSFFQLQVRRAGTNDDWETFLNDTGNIHTNLFCVRGNTDEYQYNYIKIYHPRLGLSNDDLYEYRFKPYPGNNVATRFMNKKVNLLNANIARSGENDEEDLVLSEATFVADTTIGKFVISFAGNKEFIIKVDEASNTEWIQSLNTGTGQASAVSGGVVELERYAEIGYSTAVMGPLAPAPVGEYNYDTTGDSPNETLVSINRDYSEDAMAVVVYKDGEQVAVSFESKDADLSEIELKNDPKPDPSLVHNYSTGEYVSPDDSSLHGMMGPFKPYTPPKEVYTIDVSSAPVTVNPINNSTVEYYPVVSQEPTITLSVGPSVSSTLTFTSNPNANDEAAGPSTIGSSGYEWGTITLSDPNSYSSGITISNN